MRSSVLVLILLEMVHHCDRGSEYVSADCTQDLKALGVQLLVGSRGGSYDHALVESVIGAYKAELVRERLFESVGQLEG